MLLACALNGHRYLPEARRAHLQDYFLATYGLVRVRFWSVPVKGHRISDSPAEHALSASRISRVDQDPSHFTMSKGFFALCLLQV